MVKIRQDFVPAHLAKRVTFGGINGRKWITIHQTGNTSRGANAAMHARLQKNGNSRTASWPWQVDDKEAVQSFPHTAQCFHAGDGRGNGNLNSIGVEICINSDGNYVQALRNAADLVRKIMKEENISIMNVVQHNHWSGKNCPRQLRAGKAGVTWNDFIDMVKGSSGSVEGAPAISKPAAPSSKAKLIKNEDAYFLVTAEEGIKVRNAPSVTATHTGTLEKGDSIHYYAVYEGGGYRWLQCVGNSGNKLYVPYRESGSGKERWGTFHSTRPKGTATTKPSKPVAPSSTTVAGAKLVKNENAYFLATENIKVRNAPSTSATHTGTLPKGASINYKRVFEGNGYRWLEYTGNSGNTLYLPYRPINDSKAWGTFHSSRPSSKPKKSIDEMAREVVRGDHGSGHANRRKSLGISQSEYEKVRKRVNELA